MRAQLDLTKLAKCHNLIKLVGRKELTKAKAFNGMKRLDPWEKTQVSESRTESGLKIYNPKFVNQESDPSMNRNTLHKYHIRY